MKRRIFLFAGLILLISLITGGVLFLKQTAYLSSDDSYEMMHPSDYQEQAQQPLGQNSEEFDEETQKMLAEREMAIQHLKDIGEWEEPKQRKNNDILFIIPLIVIGVFFLIFRLLFRKGINQSGSFARAKRSSFTQGLSHMGSEMKSNFEKIPPTK